MCMIRPLRPPSEEQYSEAEIRQLIKAHDSIQSALILLYRAEHIINNYASIADTEAISFHEGIDDITHRGNLLHNLIHPDYIPTLPEVD